MLPITCSTSSEVLGEEHVCINTTSSLKSHAKTKRDSLEVIRVVDIVYVIDGGLQMIGRILDLLQLPGRVMCDGGTLRLARGLAQLKANVLGKGIQY